MSPPLIRRLGVLGVLVSWCFDPAVGAEEAPPPPFTVESARPYDALTRKFLSTEGWTGSDDAYSFPLGPDRTLWVFADTWIGRIEDGRRVKPRMINNSFAWMSLADPAAPLKFFWNDAGPQPRSVIPGGENGVWMWPGDGAVVDGRCYFFGKRVRSRTEGRPGFRFHWFGDELIRVDNPRDPPTGWKIDRRTFPEDPDALRPGVACVVDGKHLYAYGLLPKSLRRPGQDGPVGVQRIPLDRLAELDLAAWETWVEGPEGPRWAAKPGTPAVLFRDGAPEFTVSRVPGIPGFVAVYTAYGMGPYLRARHAPRPEGPWSEYIDVYTCPDSGEGIFVYAAKAHPELATEDGRLILTYCRNCGELAEHVRQPGAYFPQAVEVRLAPRVGDAQKAKGDKQ